MKNERACKHCPEGVKCSADSDCNRCGWNPAVAKARLERIRKGAA